MRLLLLSAAFSLALSATVFQAIQSTGKTAQSFSINLAASAYPFMDAHTHLDPGNPQRSINVALQTMVNENADRIVFMPPPFTSDDRARFDAEIFLPQIQGHEDKLTVLGGGGTLNAMIQQSVRSGDSGPEVRRRFEQQAEALLRAGVAGFGEMAAEHFAGATPYQSAPPDHPLFLLLADIAAAHGVPIDLHMEAVPEVMSLPAGCKSPPNPPQLSSNIAAFERLLAHNRRARIVWAHAGADYAGYRTPELCRRLLAAHPNLFMEIKIDPEKPGKNSPLTNGAIGAIKPEWLQLFRDFPDRFIVGSDQHYPEPVASVQRWQAIVQLLNQLPAEVRQKIAVDNARALYLPAHR